MQNISHNISRFNGRPVISYLLTNTIFFLSLSGSIFFPLSSVNVTLTHTTFLPEPLPPLVELVLLQDIPDFLSENFRPGEARFKLVDDKSDGLFFIQGNELRVHSRFFTNDFSLPHGKANFQNLITSAVFDVQILSIIA